MLGATQLESSISAKDLGFLADTKLNMSHQYALTTKKADDILAALGKVLTLN